MKIDKRNPRHWFYLFVFALNVALAILLRPFLKSAGKPLVLLYGHKLSGNLKSLYDAIRTMEDAPCRVAFLTMDPGYYRELQSGGEAAILALAPLAIGALARTPCIVSDHGLHAMALLPRLSTIRFVDVWHGIPFKGWDAGDFRQQHVYDEIWVSSTLLRQIYVDRFGFDADRVRATGYGRTDRLIQRTEDTANFRAAIGVADEHTKLILFAPTWQHGTRDHEIFPFGLGAGEFFKAMATICEAHGAVCLFRTHLNTRSSVDAPDGPFRFVPLQRFPDTEAVLLAADVLVCDWSSIAFDYLLLDRPTIFLDVPPPFPKGFTLGPEFRFGAIASNMAELGGYLGQYLSEPEAYRQRFRPSVRQVREAVYDDFGDGHAAQRYCERLFNLIGVA